VLFRSVSRGETSRLPAAAKLRGAIDEQR